MEITPQTKVGDLLKEFPELEETLLSLSPKYELLKNPILRKTVGRVATLQQVSVVGNVPLETLINSLRSAAGLTINNAIMNSNKTDNNPPAWLDPFKISQRLDAREMLLRGEHPLNEVLSRTNAMDNNEIFELITGFVPMPLIEKVSNMGFDYYIEEAGGDEVRTYFCRK
jgi:hypothetical protein